MPDIRNLPPSDRASCTAAIRELFEETGILIADTPVPDTTALDRARVALLAGDRTFDSIAEEFDVRFTAARMAYFARWVTPSRLARRYDALFFLVALEDRAQEVTITDEHSSSLWIGSREALAGSRSGELPMLFPTWKTLEELERFADLDSAFAVLRLATVEPIEPILEVRGKTIRPRLPGGDPP